MGSNGSINPVRTHVDVLSDRFVFATLALMAVAAILGWWFRATNELDFSAD